jgi:hypothetical protein
MTAGTGNGKGNGEMRGPSTALRCGRDDGGWGGCGRDDGGWGGVVGMTALCCVLERGAQVASL